MAAVKVIRLSPWQKGKGREDGAVQEFRAVMGRGYGRSQTTSLCPLPFPKRVSASGRSHRRPLALCTVCGGSQAECNGTKQNPMSWGLTVVLGELRRGP